MDKNSNADFTRQNKNILSIATNYINEVTKIFSTGQEQNEYHEKSDLIHFYHKTSVQKFLQAQTWILIK